MDIIQPLLTISMMMLEDHPNETGKLVFQHGECLYSQRIFVITLIMLVPLIQSFVKP